jgi:hypothetical protein
VTPRFRKRREEVFETTEEEDPEERQPEVTKSRRLNRNEPFLHRAQPFGKERTPAFPQAFTF